MRQFLVLLITLYSLSAYGQTSVINVDAGSSRNAPVPTLRGTMGADMVLEVHPNPVKAGRTLIIDAENVDIYSYSIYTSYGEIVEIENLSGRPDGSEIYLPVQMNPGLYFIRFDTSAGFVVRHVMVVT